MEAITDILVLPFFGQGHLFPCVELCKLFSSYNCTSLLIIPSHLSSSIPSDLHRYPLVEVLEIPASYSPLPPPPPDMPKPESSRPGTGGPGLHRHHHQELGHGIESFLSRRYENAPSPGCVVMDVMMSWSKDIFRRANVPIVSFFTSGACSTAMEYAAWTAHVDDMVPDEIRTLSGLPETVSLTYSDLKRRDHHHGGGKPRQPGGMNFGPPTPGQPPRWLDEAEGSTALLINTCDDLEGPFLEYLAGQIQKPVLGVGPLLPEKYWKSTSSVLHDRDSRPNRESNYTEDEVIQWLESKPTRSVIYVSFGSEVGPTLEEYDELADALGESKWPFIWVIQPGSGKPGPPANFFGGKPGSNAREEGYYPQGLQEKVGNRGLIIKGWAPQLLILGHPSTGGFLSHCGWNSTVEAIGRGIPILAWPIRGDQFYNAKLVVKHLRVGHMVSNDLSEMVKKCDIIRGIEVVMGDGEGHDRAITLRGKFEAGYPPSSGAALKALIELISK
ncbi:UNVERIFIED_CONTAM: UDP-glycosyltransferase 73C2 [Sesamum latifolium]|uniref:Glycosyltransferase n=1 Tax=Sesamum latifolium TaxID=2727402 RepID=A0AAW2X438_9LAMI